MKLKKFAAIGTVAGIALALGSVATSAVAGPPQAVTTYTASPTTVRSGEQITYTANGSTNPNDSWTFVGCYVYWIDDVQFNNTINGPFFPLVGPIESRNFRGVDSTFRAAAWSGQSCVTGAEPAGTPTFDTGILTTTPQVVVDPITITVGKEISQASFPYTYEAAGGGYPFDWSTGGFFAEVTSDTCAGMLNAFISELPAGVSLNEDVSANGTAPDLVLSGTPTTVGTYDVCVELEGYSDGAASAYMTIIVEEPKLPATGLDVVQAITLAASASVLAALGAVLVLVRRRRA